MIQSKQEFLDRLEDKLAKHPDKQAILLEYDSHLTELLADLMDHSSMEKGSLMEVVIERLGTPEEIAFQWNEELSISPRKTQWVFVALNISFFIGGSILTISYNLFEWEWIETIWTYLTSIPFLIMVLYMIFWALLGYEIGKEFGYGGRSLLKKTFFVSLAPNLLLMYLTIFRLIPYDWFQPLLDLPFIISCILGTLCLYPICWAGYRWGKRASI